MSTSRAIRIIREPFPSGRSGPRSWHLCCGRCSRVTSRGRSMGWTSSPRPRARTRSCRSASWSSRSRRRSISRSERPRSRGAAVPVLGDYVEALELSTALANRPELAAAFTTASEKIAARRRLAPEIEARAAYLAAQELAATDLEAATEKLAELSKGKLRKTALRAARCPPRGGDAPRSRRARPPVARRARSGSDACGAYPDGVGVPRARRPARRPQATGTSGL